MKGKKDHDAAAQEAFEEADVVGEIHSHPVGAYTYEKGHTNGSEMIRVMVYRLDVSAQRKDWPEKSQRVRRWMTLNEAAKVVDESGLSEISYGSTRFLVVLWHGDAVITSFQSICPSSTWLVISTCQTPASGLRG